MAALGASAASAAMVGSVLLAPAAVAQDAPVSPSAYAVAASGLIDVDPTPYVEGDEGPVSKISTALPTDAQAILELKALNAESMPGKSWSSVAELRLGGGSLPEQLSLHAELIKSTCSVEDGMSSKLVGLTIAGNSQDIAVPANTEVVPAQLQDIARITLNKQTENADGSMTVTAVSIHVLEGEMIPAQLSEVAGQTINLASATCGPAEDGGETTPPDNGEDDGDKDNGDGDDAEEDGTAPTPVPQPDHIAVTG